MADTISAPRRRKQADRSAQTQEKVVQAAIMLLQTKGYAATTIQAIARTAGVSLGAMQHHFPTKAQVMAAVLRHYGLKRAKLYRQSLSKKTKASDRIDSMLDATWLLISQGAEFMATVEIELARRSDLELAAATQPVLARIDQFMTRWLYGDLSEEPNARYVQMRLLTSAFLRGLAVEVARGIPLHELESVFNIWRVFAKQEFLKIGTHREAELSRNVCGRLN